MRLLHTLGVDINAAHNDGRTPLNQASSYGNSEVVKLLRSLAADKNQSDSDGETTKDKHPHCCLIM